MIRPPGRPRLGVSPLPDNMMYRECETCQRRFAKPTNVTWTRWLRRRFCSHDCYHEARRSA